MSPYKKRASAWKHAQALCRCAECQYCAGSILGLILTLLIDDAAGSLAGRLAGSLALAAAAVDDALVQITGFNGLDSGHDSAPPMFEPQITVVIFHRFIILYCRKIIKRKVVEGWAFLTVSCTDGIMWLFPSDLA